MISKIVTIGLLAAQLVSVAGAAHADAQDDAIRTKCPAAQAWTDKMRAAHPDDSADAGVAKDRSARFTDPMLRDAIHTRFVADQAVRNAWTAANASPEATKAMFLSDRERLAWIKPQFTTHGFPTVAQVGYVGVSEAFTLVQHADQDPGFQAAMLPSITKAAKAGDVQKGDVAMLTDRVLRHQGKPQRYGSQYDVAPGNVQHMTLQATEDPAHLDERRASMELMPYKDYECVLSVVYNPAGAAAP